MMDTAQQIVTQVAQGDFAAVEQRLAGRIKPYLSAGAIQATWQGVEKQFGAFQQLVKTSNVQTLQGLVQVVTCAFERASLDVNITSRLPTAAAADLPLGVPAAYWLDLNSYHPEKVAQTLKKPMLFLQVEADYQVTQEDFQIWQGALSGRSDVQFILYHALSHLFMTTEGEQKATPVTYTVPGHVVEEVVNDIGSGIKRHSKLPSR